MPKNPTVFINNPANTVFCDRIFGLLKDGFILQNGSIQLMSWTVLFKVEIRRKRRRVNVITVFNEITSVFLGYTPINLSVSGFKCSASTNKEKIGGGFLRGGDSWVSY